LSAYHIANRFRDEDRITRCERVVEVFGNHLRIVAIFNNLERAGFRHRTTPLQLFPLRLKPELNQAADGFGTARRIFAGPFLNAAHQVIRDSDAV
jgi:hypothetical protein